MSGQRRGTMRRRSSPTHGRQDSDALLSTLPQLDGMPGGTRHEEFPIEPHRTGVVFAIFLQEGTGILQVGENPLLPIGLNILGGYIHGQRQRRSQATAQSLDGLQEIVGVVGHGLGMFYAGRLYIDRPGVDAKFAGGIDHEDTDDEALGAQKPASPRCGGSVHLT